jgi:hypothetical protein
MAPAWFDTNNFWAAHNPRLLGSLSGTISGSEASYKQAFLRVPYVPTTGLLCGAGAVRGLTAPGDEHFGPEPPQLAIFGGGSPGGDQWADGLQDYGAYGLQVEAPLTPGWPLVDVVHVEECSRVVSLQWRTEDDPVGRPGVPPYWPEMDYVRLAVQFRRTHHSDGRPVWTGEYYLELYDYVTPPAGEVEPGEACPPLPKWPYNDVISISARGGIIPHRRTLGARGTIGP